MPVTVPDTAEHNALANKVALLESTQKLHSQTLANHATEIARLYDRVAALEQQPVPIPAPIPEPIPEPVPEPVPETPDFTLALIGGWRLNEPWSEGGLAIDFAANRCWTAGHDQQNNLVEYQLPAMGTGTNHNQWPLVSRTRNLGTMYWSGIQRFGQQSYTCGLMYRDGLLWVSGREFYTPYSNPSTILKKFDVSGTPILRETVTMPNRPMQKFGGGFIKGGPEVLVGNGGYESGQGSAAGPCWMKLDGTIINEFGHFDAPKDQREKREGNYSISNFWVPIPPDSDGTGYWFAGRIYGGGLVINGQTCIWSSQGIGAVNYTLQNETFTSQQQQYVHKYLPGQHYGTWERFETPAGMRNKAGIRGCEISPDGKRVYLFVHSVVIPNGFDWCPAVFCYEVR